MSTLPVDILPFTVLLPADGETIDVIDHTTNLRIGLMSTTSCAELSEDWNVPGVYVLLKRPRANGTYFCYVGRTGSLMKRLADHAESRHFYRALLVRRESHNSLHSTQVNWLEGDLYEMFRFARFARLENKQVPREDSVPDYELPVLARLRDPVKRVLALVGHDVTVGPKPVNMADPSETTLLDLVLGGQLHPGCPLRPADEGPGLDAVEAEITDDGRIAWGGRTWNYPSQAARAVLTELSQDSTDVSGWRFWAVPTKHDGLVPLATFRDRYVRGDIQSEVNDAVEPAAS
ncbi:hypothetical protein [Ornithinimicrobium murale]|uniref:restriction system modified-DNA reader domain-containing protein n=1 Tax=Ornithinimicrobium murale TaxID=1050153 RepID=UPI000E0CF65E|nr:hypothetical protein [Ornithinimicrobium murale]